MSPPTLQRVLVTGAGGLIGRAVVRALTADGLDVMAHLGPPDASMERPAAPVRFGFAAIDDGAAIARLAEGVQAIVHLAGPPSVAASFRDPAGHARAHCLGTANVLEACRAHGVRRLVYISSAEVYGRPESNPVAEGARLAPLSPYAAMKVAAESLIATCRAEHGLQAVVLRPFSVVGAPVSPYSVLGTILRQAFGADGVAVQEPTFVRDFVFVDDVAQAISRALQIEPSAPVCTYNVGSGSGTSVGDLARLVLQRLGKPPLVRKAAATDRHTAVDIPHLVADPRLAAAELGWQARTGLPEALARIIDDFAHRAAAGGPLCGS